MELLVIIHDCKIASAQRITAVLPYLPYCKQSKKKHSRSGVTAKLMANMLKIAGVDHIVTMDLHASQIQGFFNIPVDNLFAEPSIAAYLRRNVIGIENAIVVAKNAGATKRVTSLADRLGLGFALIHKETTRQNYSGSLNDQSDCSLGTTCESSSVVPQNWRRDDILFSHEERGPIMEDYHHVESFDQKPMNTTLGKEEIACKPIKETLTLVGDVKDRIALLADDILDSCPSFIIAADFLKNEKQAIHVIIVVTHAILTEDMAWALQRASSIDRIVVTNSSPIPASVVDLCDKLHVIDISDILSEAIRRIHNGESISHLFSSLHH